MTEQQTKPKRTLSLTELISADRQENELASTKTETTSAGKKNTKASIAEVHKAKKENRFYLPVLRLNDKSAWESKLLSERKHLTDKLATEACLSNCNGHTGLKSGCCKLDPNDLEHVLGPIGEDWIERTIKWFHKKGMAAVTRHDLVIDFEEGKILGETFFNSHPVFMKKDTYPILRIQADGPRFACKFLNVHTGKCTIYPIRPEMCANYYCQYLKSNFLINLKRSPNHSGEWTAVDLTIERKKSLSKNESEDD